MDAISLRCKACQHVMKFSADKVGKKAKCSKCGTPLMIQAEKAVAQKKAGSKPPPAPVEEAEDTIQLVDAEPAAVAQAAADISSVVGGPVPTDEPTKPKFDEFTMDGPDEYGVSIDPELEERQRILREEEEAKLKQKKTKKKLPKVGRKLKPIEQAEDWEKVRMGLFLMFISVCIWMLAHALHGLYVLLGSVELSEYAQMIATVLEKRGGDGMPGPGQFWDVNEFNIYMEIIAGRNFAGVAKACVIIGALLYLLQALANAGGYAMCLAVPRRFGMFGQVMTMMILLVVNGLAALFLRLLPVLGVYNYIMIALIAPEIAMTEYNMERLVPINILWSGWPFWENFGTLIFNFLFYLEPTFACIFVWSIGIMVKDEGLATSGKNMTQLCLGTFFIYITFHLLSLCGTSQMIILVLRVVYTLWFCFLLLFMLNFALLLLRCRAVLELKIHPTDELTE